MSKTCCVAENENINLHLTQTRMFAFVYYHIFQVNSQGYRKTQRGQLRNVRRGQRIAQKYQGLYMIEKWVRKKEYRMTKWKLLKVIKWDKINQPIPALYFVYEKKLSKILKLNDINPRGREGGRGVLSTTLFWKGNWCSTCKFL